MKFYCFNKNCTVKEFWGNDNCPHCNKKGRVAEIEDFMPLMLRTNIEDTINQTSDVNELASIYSLGQTILDISFEEGTEIVEAVEKRVNFLELSDAFDELI